VFRVSIGEYEVSCQADGLQAMLAEYRRAPGARDQRLFVGAGLRLLWYDLSRPAR